MGSIPPALFLDVPSRIKHCVGWHGNRFCGDEREYIMLIRTGQNLNIIGTSGAGKTVQGARIAGLLGIPFYDNDEAVKRHNGGMQIPDIFKLKGESGFRRDETSMLGFAVENGSQVVATGAGIVTIPDNVELLKKGVNLWIHPSLDIVLRRLKKKTDRPNALDAQGKFDADKVTRLYYERCGLYKDLADFHVPIPVEMEKDEITELIRKEFCLK